MLNKHCWLKSIIFGRMSTLIIMISLIDTYGCYVLTIYLIYKMHRYFLMHWNLTAFQTYSLQLCPVCCVLVRGTSWVSYVSCLYDSTRRRGLQPKKQHHPEVDWTDGANAICLNRRLEQNEEPVAWNSAQTELHKGTKFYLNSIKELLTLVSCVPIVDLKHFDNLFFYTKWWVYIIL